ncbi:type I polyketide synthase [Mycolicibacterium rufum]|uniref:Type I polyketide synthase n=1 Tax=Mycolicibacterium rufum TaxID=318424 RepID=A0A9X2YG91_9MYCO|nr:type I polyketide synthase [Mycolicibacterium rufum]KGI70693.1 polyketide synthase [Mycolicibacterium rufum]MCV7072673.1 type I polyketide synthase [Mycolicibacterium rufum]ULP38141.1 type I polyketide synthase [Mycolicibacterium rufum]
MTGATEERREALAIVGIGCRLPGGVDSPQDYWRLLLSETDATREVPESRWHAARFHDPHPGKAGKMVTRRGGYLEEIDQFDAAFFGISPREANLLDPQQRLLLHATWEALEDGGIPPEGLAGSDVGVFIGGFTLDYQLLQNQGRTSRFRFKPHSATGMMMTMLANRISFAFDFRGPSMAIDTACSSSLVAVHLAAQSIWNGDCELALAGGVNIIVGPNTAIAESKSGFLSPDGRCKAFDASADGYARGEGGAVVVIKPLSQALRDGDRVYAQILGTAVTQDGHTDGITVPSEDAQRAAITTALQRAGVAPGDVGYVEAHGTGTPVGDPVETRALAGALAAGRSADDPLLIGSVKTNIGHLEAGAGVAGLIKAALALQHGTIPASLHLNTPSSPLAELHLDVPRTARSFPAGKRHVAGVNSFGFGGTNAHVVLAEPPSTPATPGQRGQTGLTLLPLSARSEEALTATAQQLAEHLRAQPDLTLSDLGYTLSRRRSHLSYRRTLTVDSIDDARDQLDALAAGGGQAALGRSGPDTPKLAFVCTGMGPQWAQMCRGLLDVYPEFTASIERTDRELSRHTDWSLIEELRRDDDTSRMAETEIAQPANFAIQIALAEQLRHFGIVPDAVIGHSAGEVAAHHLAGLLTFEQAVAVIYHRSRLQQRTTGLGRMVAVGLGAEALLQTLDAASAGEFGHRVSVAAINSPHAVTIAGDEDVLADIVRQLDEAQVFNRYLAVKVPYHTHYMDTVREDLYAAFDGLSSAPAAIPLYSTVTGEQLTGYAAGAAYWWQNTRATVLFEAAARRMLDDGYTHFVELGPHPVLASSLLEIAGSQRVLTVASQRRGDDDARTLMNCVGTVHSHGHDIDWKTVHPADGGHLVALPTYPWQSKRYWNETPEAAEDLHYTPVHPLLGQPVAGAHPTWEVELSTAVLPFLADHQVQGTVVVPGAVFLEMALAAASVTYGSACSVDDLVLHRALILDDTCDPVVRTTLDEAKGTLEFTAFTAIGDGDFGWTVTATAELNTLGSPPAHDVATDDQPAVHLRGDDFYARTASLGFAYGEMFRPVRDVGGGEDWARAQLAIPAGIADDLEDFHFHPALIDGAFQTLFGTTAVDAAGAGAGTYLPTRIRHSAVYGRPQQDMSVHVRVVSAGREEIESDITIVDRLGETLAVLHGFTVQSLSASSAMSTERIDRNLYEVHWTAQPPREDVASVDAGSWVIFADTVGFGAALARQLRDGGHRVCEVIHQPVDTLTEVDDGYAVDPQRAEQIQELLDVLQKRHGNLTGVVDFWPVDIYAGSDDRLGVITLLHVVNALAQLEGAKPRLHIVTANAQPALGTEELAVDQATVWGLGRVIGHQEFPELWGGLIDIDDTDDVDLTAARLRRHLLDVDAEDQIALRGELTLAPRLRPCAALTKPFPTKLSANATYVVTGGTGALGRSVAFHLAERGARHITLLSRREIPARALWPQMTHDDPHFATVETIRRIERLGAQVRCAAVDITDAEHVERWRDDHLRDGLPPVRGIVHAAGSVDDRLVVNMTEQDFASVMAPKVLGTRLLHNAFEKAELEFFVMFGSAGSVIASPGQGNYAAANAYLDAFAHYRRARGLPALTIGWGPWSVGMVEELKLERIYAQRGIELITPGAGVRILDRLIAQKTPHVVAITADWGRARQASFSAHLPAIFNDLEAGGAAADAGGASLIDVLAATPDDERLGVVTDHVRDVVAAVFDCAATDIDPEVMLDDLGLDSMMAMEFRVRVNSLFSIDLPVLEILRGVSVNSLAARILTELRAIHAESEAEAAGGDTQIDTAADAEADVDRLIATLSDDELRALLDDLEGTGQS